MANSCNWFQGDAFDILGGKLVVEDLVVSQTQTLKTVINVEGSETAATITDSEFRDIDMDGVSWTGVSASGGANVEVRNTRFADSSNMTAAVSATDNSMVTIDQVTVTKVVGSRSSVSYTSC